MLICPHCNETTQVVQLHVPAILRHLAAFGTADQPTAYIVNKDDYGIEYGHGDQDYEQPWVSCLDCGERLDLDALGWEIIDQVDTKSRMSCYILRRSAAWKETRGCSSVSIAEPPKPS